MIEPTLISETFIGDVVYTCGFQDGLYAALDLLRREDALSDGDKAHEKIRLGAEEITRRYKERSSSITTT